MICQSIDDYVQDLRWIVTLSNGTEVFQDDNRPGLEWNAWTRLYHYLQQNPDLTIIGMRLEFRSHVERLPSHADGYYFSHGMSAVFMSQTWSNFVAGYAKDGVLYKSTWRVPELCQIDYDEIKDLDKLDHRFIWSKIHVES